MNHKVISIALLTLVFASCSLTPEEIAQKGCECNSEDANSEVACEEFENALKSSSLTSEEKLKIVIKVNKCIMESDKKKGSSEE